MRTCAYCGRSTEGRHEQCKGCNAPLPATNRTIENSPILSSPSYYTFDYRDTYEGQLEELNKDIDSAFSEIGRALLEPIWVMKRVRE